MNWFRGHIPISILNDFLFCPYSIYLLPVYMMRQKRISFKEPQKV